MTGRAFAAIVGARLHAERRTIALACAAAAIAGFLQPHDLAGAFFFGSSIGTIVALVQTAGRFPHLDLGEWSAPLFGRELARAKALVPCIAAMLATAAYCAAAEAAGMRDLPRVFIGAFAAVIATTLTAMCATIRAGTARLLYVALAAGACGGAYALLVAGRSLPGEFAFCALVSFLALRQYGEALARYDPL